jgi:DNA-binding response OmpR family regulator
MKKKGKILYIEDQINREKEFPEIIKMSGYDVDEALDGDQALKKLRECEGGYGLIILDIMMPTGEELASEISVKGGFETGKIILEKLRKELKLKTPVIVLTAYGKSDLESELRKYGISEFISKPITPTDLIRYIEIHI